MTDKPTPEPDHVHCLRYCAEWAWEREGRPRWSVKELVERYYWTTERLSRLIGRKVP